MAKFIWSCLAGVVWLPDVVEQAVEERDHDRFAGRTSSRWAVQPRSYPGAPGARRRPLQRFVGARRPGISGESTELMQPQKANRSTTVVADAIQEDACAHCHQPLAVDRGDRPIEAHRCPGCGYIQVLSCAEELAAEDDPGACGPTGDLVGSVRADRYRLLRRLGSGSGGRVFLARHLHLDELCVVKILNSASSSPSGDTVDRVRNEARTGFNVNHANVARVLDCDSVNGVGYYVMEFVPGLDLGAIVERFGPLCWRQVVDIGREVAAGLVEIHRLGLVHRDIKPDNLLLCADHHVKITDLGLAGLMEDTETADPSEPRVAGTLMYMAPEQLSGDLPIDARADFYAIGATLFHLLVGRPHRADVDPLDLLSGRVIDQLSWPDDVLSDAPRWVLDTIELCLAIDPDKRLRSAAELVEALVYEERMDRADLLARRSSPDSKSLGVVVAPFENLAQDPSDGWIGYAIAEHLDSRLIELPGVRVVDSRRFATLIERRGTPAGQLPPRAEALRAARETGAEVIVYGRYQRAGDQLWMNAYAIRQGLDEPQPLGRRTGTRDAMVSLCEDLADDVVRVLLAGTDPSQLPGRSRRGTRSLQANQRYIIGRRLFANGQYEDAIRLATEALEIDPEYVEPVGFIGACYSRLGQYRLALEYHARNQFIARQHRDPYRMAEALSNLGVMYYYMGEYHLALEYMERAATLECDLGTDSVLAKNCNNMGYVLMRLERLEEAREAFLRSIELNKGVGDLVSLISPYNGIGGVALHLGSLDEARAYYSRALNLADELGDRVNVGVSRINIGRCACLLKQYDHGRGELLLALQMLEDTSHWNALATAHQYLADLYVMTDDPAEACEHAQKSIELAQRHQNRHMQVQGWELKARAWARADDRSEALACLRRALDASPETDRQQDLEAYLREIVQKSVVGERGGRTRTA